MIKKIAIVGDGIELKDDLKKYITKKIGKLDHYLPRHARKTAFADIKMRETAHGKNSANKYECEVLIEVPGEQITAKEATINMFAAVDIVETKLKNQLRKYKELTTEHQHGRGRWRKLLRRGNAA